MGPLASPSRGISLSLLALSLIASAAVAPGRAQAPRPAPARTPPGPSRIAPNNPEGLRTLLANLLATARNADPGRLDALVVALEIPNYREWFVRTFGEARGESDSDLYGRTLDQSENELEKQVRQLAAQGGDFEVRKVNDAPRGAETEMLARFEERTDVYFVSWTPKGPKGNSGSFDADAFPYPYFLFIDGKFRWDPLQRIAPPDEDQPVGAPQIPENNIPPKRTLPPSQNGPSRNNGQQQPGSQQPASGTGAPTIYTPGVNGVGYPSCLSCPSPVYPDAARSENLEGDVVLNVTIGVDGHASNITLVSTSDLIFNEYAIAAVRNWRFKPAPGPDGKPVPVVTAIEIGFRMPHP